MRAASSNRPSFIACFAAWLRTAGSPACGGDVARTTVASRKTSTAGVAIVKRPGQRIAAPASYGRRSRLEGEAHAHLHRAWHPVVVERPDAHEVQIGEPCHRDPPLRVVEHVLGLDPNLQTRVVDRDGAEERRVQVVVRRSAEGVAAGVAPRIAWLREEQWVIPWLVRP